MEQPNAHVPCSHKSQCNIPLGERLHHYTTVKRQEVDNSSCKAAGFTSLFPCVLIDVWIWSGAATELRFLTFASLSDTLPHPLKLTPDSFPIQNLKWKQQGSVVNTWVNLWVNPCAALFLLGSCAVKACPTRDGAESLFGWSQLLACWLRAVEVVLPMKLLSLYI